MSKRPLIVLTGPTAVGKTALSIRLAKALDGEIISADSMQVYRGMDIGSAKVTKKEMDGVRHHLIDVLEPEEDFNVAAFQRMAKEALEEIYSRGKLPIVAAAPVFTFRPFCTILISGTTRERDPFERNWRSWRWKKERSTFTAFCSKRIPNQLTRFIPTILSGWYGRWNISVRPESRFHCIIKGKGSGVLHTISFIM